MSIKMFISVIFLIFFLTNLFTQSVQNKSSQERKKVECIDKDRYYFIRINDETGNCSIITGFKKIESGYIIENETFLNDLLFQNDKLFSNWLLKTDYNSENVPNQLKRLEKMEIGVSYLAYPTKGSPLEEDFEKSFKIVKICNGYLIYYFRDGAHITFIEDPLFKNDTLFLGWINNDESRGLIKDKIIKLDKPKKVVKIEKGLFYWGYICAGKPGMYGKYDIGGKSWNCGIWIKIIKVENGYLLGDIGFLNDPSNQNDKLLLDFISNGENDNIIDKNSKIGTTKKFEKIEKGLCYSGNVSLGVLNTNISKIYITKIENGFIIDDHSIINDPLYENEKLFLDWINQSEEDVNQLWGGYEKIKPIEKIEMGICYGGTGLDAIIKIHKGYLVSDHAVVSDIIYQNDKLFLSWVNNFIKAFKGD